MFANSSATTDSHSATPWTRTPQDLNYGTGNASLATGSLGTAGSRAVYQSTINLNMPASAINPRTGTAFGTGAWNTAGLGNLNSQTVATTATLFVANPGTGLTQVDRTDAQWLETTGRLANGASFNMTTRDVNSGTRNVAALETGIDPTWAVGLNDNGNGNASDAGTNQVSIGPGLRFSNKTAGGGQLRPTVQAARMAVGTLSINDAASGTNRTVNTAANPVRALAYSDSTDGSAPYVQANYYTIAGVQNGSANPNNQQYTIFQNEQFVTLKAPDASYGSATPNIQGDDATHDTQALINNTLQSVVAFNGSSPASPAAGLAAQGYIIPQLMNVQKAQNGLNQAGLPSQIVANPNYNAAAGSAVIGTLANALNTGLASSVTTGSGSFYGGSSLSAGGVTGSVVGYDGQAFNGQIPITNTNYLFGNFNQTGVRDYDSVVVQAQKAEAALEASGAGTNAYGGTGQSVNGTHVTTGISALDTANGGAGVTKGDLIVLGDYNGDGAFDGRDLYDMATGASLATPGMAPTETVSGGTPTFTTGHINATAATFGAAIATSTLYKNTALDYLQANATASQKQEARAVLEGASVPSGATAVGTDPESGQAQYTFDPTGANAFNKSDVNADGVVDMNDAVLVDKFAGFSYSNMSGALTATEQAPVTGATELANLVLVKQTDVGTTITSNQSGQTGDLDVINAALTGTGNTNWYGYNLQKTGAGTITMARAAGTVTVYAGASFQVSGGTVQVGKVQDPFTDNTSGTTTAGNHVALLVDTGGKVQFTGSSGISTVASLSINTASGGQVDVGQNSLKVNYTSGNSPLTTIAALVASGYNSGTNNGPGIISSSADATHGVGYIDTGSNVTVRYTLNGDTDLDGSVGLADVGNIKKYLGTTSGAIWSQGDFDHDGVVGLKDVGLMKANLGHSLTFSNVAVSPASARVPQQAVASPATVVAPPSGGAALVVYTDTGDVQLLLNNTALGGYEIDSAKGELVPSRWTTLNSRGNSAYYDYPSNSGGSPGSANVLGEADFNGAVTLNGTFDLGQVFNQLTLPASRDLTFSYQDANDNTLPVAVDYEVSAAPEPTSLVLFGLANAGLIARRRRRA